MASKSTYSDIPGIDSSPIKNPMKLQEEKDTDLFPRYKQPSFTHIRATLGAEVCMRYKYPKPSLVRSDPEMMDMIHKSGISEKTIFRILFDER